MSTESTETLTSRHCDHCGGEVSVAVWLPDGSDHAVIIEGPLSVETVHVTATNHAQIRAAQDVRFAWCRSLPAIRDVDDTTGVPAGPCPECAQGKHVNCDGTTWDVAADAPAPCPCAAQGHL